jgi:hypothetical protein
MPAIEKNPPINHLIAEIRVEQASLIALVDFAQDSPLLTQSATTVIEIACEFPRRMRLDDYHEIPGAWSADLPIGAQ